MKIIITEEQKKKLFIPRKLNKDDHRWMDHNNSQPIKNIDDKEIRINQYDENGRKQGYWEWYYNDGQLLKKGSYKDDKEYGYWEIYYDNGQLYHKGTYVDGKMNGYWEIYYSDGELDCKGSYIDGKMNGYWEEYYENGEISRKGNYVNGKMNGYWENYYSNGKLMFKGNYKNDKRDGYWETYYDNGKLYLKGNYKNGKFVKDLKESEEPKKKKLFIPRKIDERNELFFKEIKFIPILNVLKDGGTLIFEMSTPYVAWDWELVLCELNDKDGNYINIPNTHSPVKSLLMRIIEEGEDGAILIRGDMVVKDNKLDIDYAIEKVIIDGGVKTYNL